MLVCTRTRCLRRASTGRSRSTCMTLDQPNTSSEKPPSASGRLPLESAKLPLDSADAWVIAPDLHLGFAERLREVWRYRRILLFFAWKSIQRLYANTRIGPAWLLV